MGATNLIPGSSATEIASTQVISASIPGFLRACVIHTSSIFDYPLIATLYALYGSLPQIAQIFYGIKPSLVIVLSAVFRLGREALKSCLLQEAVFTISFFVNGVAALFIGLFRHPLAEAGACSVSLPVVFSENGSTLFGTGYALFACMKSTVNYRCFSEAQFLDAVAVGQKTPGPFLSTATFVGYLLSGLDGAVVSTAGIFPPSFSSFLCLTER